MLDFLNKLFKARNALTVDKQAFFMRPVNIFIKATYDNFNKRPCSKLIEEPNMTIGQTPLN